MPAPDLPALLSALAHDLRTPLSTIYGFGRTLERQVELDARGARFVSLILEAAGDMERQLDQVSTIGRVLSGRLEPAREVVSPAAVVAAALDARPPRPDARTAQAVEGSEAGAVLTAVAEAGRAVALVADAALRLDVGVSGATIAPADGGVRVAPFAPEVREIVLEGRRDLALATAHVLLDVLDGALEPLGDDAVLVRLPPAPA